MNQGAIKSLPIITNGCMYHNDCFTCPFRDCKLTLPEAGRDTRGQLAIHYGRGKAPISEIQKLHREGKKPMEIVKILGVSYVTIWRHLGKNNETSSNN